MASGGKASRTCKVPVLHLSKGTSFSIVLGDTPVNMATLRARDRPLIGQPSRAHRRRQQCSGCSRQHPFEPGRLSSTKPTSSRANQSANGAIAIPIAMAASYTGTRTPEIGAGWPPGPSLHQLLLLAASIGRDRPGKTFDRGKAATKAAANLRICGSRQSLSSRLQSLTVVLLKRSSEDASNADERGCDFNASRGGLEKDFKIAFAPLCQLDTD